MMALVVVYMGSPKRLVDSDARAKLAEALESLLPPQNEDGSYTVSKTYELIFLTIRFQHTHNITNNYFLRFSFAIIFSVALI